VATPTTLLDASTLARGATGLHLLVMGPKQFATFALPVRGEVIVGRGGGDGVDVKLEDAKASRRHLRLHIGDDIEVEDLGSANGTRVHERKLAPGTRVRVLPGEAIAVGALVLMVQPNRARAHARPLSHAEFESRVEWECARAEATAGTFSVARLKVHSDARVDATVLRPIDVMGQFGPGEYELLLPGVAGDSARGLVEAFARRPPGRGGPAGGVGLASYPADGRHAAALLARAAANRRDAPSPRPPHIGEQYDRPIVCVDERMQRVQALAQRAGGHDINVLILGETGVGKEVLARAVHAASPRASRPMACINCAALAPTVLESELFGHERGAFTGAAQAKEGLLETAPGGTVFLDEVGELSLGAQAKLLRVIETRSIVRVGGVRPRPIDVRFISATNRDLEIEVARGGFRRDLFFRLNGIALTIPPLRERPLDLPVLARAFVAELARGPAPEISEAAMDALLAHGWPGNVRELRNAIERALLLCDGPTIEPEHLPSPVPFALDVAATEEASRAMPGDERARIIAALAACGGNQSRTARQLGISRKVLIARLDRYGTARPRKPGRR
jgi:DNA-binding NtrC family response regulator